MVNLYFYLLESNNEYPFNFIATYSDNQKEHPIKYLFSAYNDDSKEMIDILSFIGEIGKKSKFLAKFIQSGEFFHPLGITGQEANTFLQEIEVYEKMGIVCRLPKWNENKAVKVKPIMKEKRESSMRVLDFNVSTSIDGQDITIEELRKIAEELAPLAQIKNKWVKLNKSQIKKTLEVVEKLEKMASGEDIKDAVEDKKDMEEIAEKNDIKIEFTNAMWLEVLGNKIRNLKSVEEINLESLKIKLRDYQKTSVEWLNKMYNAKLGACLALDMGLGKSAVVIGFLNHLKTIKRKKHLIIVPTSLIQSWTSEIMKFAPNLKYYILHSSANTKLNPKSIKDFDSYDIFISTYSYFAKLDWVMNYEFESIILDEAQAIKNPETKQTQNVNRLKSNFRVAMSGTPYENSLSDIYSIFSFLNPGILGGTLDEFKTFCRRNSSKYEQVKKIIEPFMLRYMKTDKTIISDLPEKVEHTIMVDLSHKQAALYSNLIDKIRSADIKNVLPFLVKLKQLSVHSSLYLGIDDYKEEDSGKFKALRSICEDIKSKNESVVIFSQFAEVIPYVSDFVASIFGKEGLILHGGIPTNKRGDIVEKFQSGAYPYIICSVRACGYGLNLQNSCHSIFLDEWYNPSVLKQCQDRIYRIGQDKPCTMYTLISKGTLEEGIHNIIEEKKEAFEKVIPSKQERFLTDLIQNEIVKTFRIAR